MSPLQSICTKCGICVRVFSYVKDNHVENLYMYIYIYICMYICMYVYIYIYIYFVNLEACKYIVLSYFLLILFFVDFNFNFGS